MSLYQREGSPFWWYNFTINGERFRGSTRETGKREAKAVEDALKAEARKKPRYEGEWRLRYVFGAYWNDHASSRRSAKTIEHQLAMLSDILGKDTLASKLTEAHLIRYRAKRRGMGLTDASINREMVVLRAAFTHAAQVHKQRVPDIRWAKVLAQEPPGRDRFLSEEEYAALLDSAHPSIRPIIICAVLTGLRKENILSLEWRQVMLPERIIQMLVKGNKRHAVRIVPQLMAVLSATNPEDRKGKVFDRTNFQKRWKAALKDAGIDDFRFHDLRHTFASWARQSGAGIEDVCQALGHSDISMTMRYAHIKPDSTETAFDRVSERILSHCPSHRLQKGRI